MIRFPPATTKDLPMSSKIKKAAAPTAKPGAFPKPTTKKKGKAKKKSGK